MIVVDVETTGVDTRKCSILSVGAVELESPLNQFYFECSIRDGAKIEDEALRVNGFKLEDILPGAKIPENVLVKQFAHWAEPITDRTLGGENIGVFDFPVLQAAWGRASLPWIFGRRCVDLHSVSYETHAKHQRLLLKDHVSAVKGDITFNFVGLPEEPKPHHALNGAKLEAEAFYRLRYGKNLLEEFYKFPVPEYLIPWNEWAERYS